MIAFFAAEAKTSTVPLEGHLAQVLLKLIAWAKNALITGNNWHFIVVDLNTDGDGAQYWVSELIEWKTKRGATSRERFAQATSDEFDPALVAGILSTWVSTNDLCHPQSKPTRLIFIAIRFNGVSKSSMVINGSRCSLVEEVYEDVYSPCRV